MIMSLSRRVFYFETIAGKILSRRIRYSYGKESK